MVAILLAALAALIIGKSVHVIEEEPPKKAGFTVFDEKTFAPLKIYCYELPKIFQESNESESSLENVLHKQILNSKLLTKNPSEADFFFIPVSTKYVTSGKDDKNLTKLINYTKTLGPWFERKGGIDHIIALNGYHESMDFLLEHSNIIVVGTSPESSKSWKTFHGQRNIAIPYPVASYVNDTNKPRKYKAFFETKKDVHAKLNKEVVKQLKNINSDIIETSKALTNKEKQSRMSNSEFCICLNDIQNEIANSLVSGCIPFIITDNATLPYENTLLDYYSFSIIIPEVQAPRVSDIIQSIHEEKRMQLMQNIKEALRLYKYNFDGEPMLGDAFWGFSWTLYIKYLYQSQYKNRYIPLKQIEIKRTHTK